jgi:uncharacterized protein (DUF2062 family)
MQKISTIFLQTITLLIGVGIFVFMLVEPHFEGRNLNATFLQIYFNDLFLAYAYIGSIPLFIALYQIFKVLGYIRTDRVFSQASIQSLQIIRYGVLTTASFVFAAVMYLWVVSPGDDIAGGVAMGLFITFVSIVIATSASVFEKILQNGMDKKLKD